MGVQQQASIGRRRVTFSNQKANEGTSMSISQHRQERRVRSYTAFNPQKSRYWYNEDILKGGQIFFLSFRFVSLCAHLMVTKSTNPSNMQMRLRSFCILAPAQTPQYAKIFSPPPPYLLFSLYILISFLHSLTIHSADWNTRSLGEHSGSNIHRCQLLEEQLGSIRNMDLWDLRLILAGSALERLGGEFAVAG